MAAHLGIKLINRGEEGELLLKGILDSVSGTFGIDFEALASKADTLSPITVIVALYVACVVILTISLICSIRIMQKKEF